jgi:inosine-uridine nucleoside N-ribohydrolase
MGLDDARALILLCHCQEVRITAIVTSDGSAGPRAGYENARRILQYLDIKGVSVGIGRTLGVPPWREKSDTLGWVDWPASIVLPPVYPGATDIIMQTVNNVKDPLTYVCLGPLTNLAQALQLEDFPYARIAKVLYFGGPPEANEPGWNTQRDPEAAQCVFQSRLPVWAFQVPPEQLLAFDIKLYDAIRGLPGPGARLITAIHRDPRVQALMGTRHSMVWDEMVALYLKDARLVQGKISDGTNPVFLFQHWDKAAARTLFFKMLDQ